MPNIDERDGPEIEITEEMKKAGTDELAAYDRETDDGEAFVVRLFEAMELARIPSDPKTPPKPKPGADSSNGRAK